MTAHQPLFNRNRKHQYKRELYVQDLRNSTKNHNHQITNDCTNLVDCYSNLTITNSVVNETAGNSSNEPQGLLLMYPTWYIIFINIALHGFVCTYPTKLTNNIKKHCI
uniref:Transmembrane protein n=1 Tax=Glossina austeni TaxID=7395 RepID=A0A1A9UDF5_GLOAU